jgi:hypothetical protein
VNLGKESLGTEYCGELGEENLDCDFSSVAEVFCEVDGGHASLTDLAVDTVSVGECGGEAFGCSQSDSRLE